MKRPWTHVGTRDVGVALSPDRLIAFVSSRGAQTPQFWTQSLTQSPTAGVWSDLGEALGALRSAVAGTTLHVALMPPLAYFRRLELTGVNEAEATRIVRRDPSRFLPLQSGRGVSVEMWGDGWRRTSPFTLIAAPDTILDALDTAARASGWTLGSVAPAALAWARAPGLGRLHDVIACLGTDIEVIRAERGRPVALRRIPNPGSELTPSQVVAALAERGIEIQPNATVMLSDDEAMALAARHITSVAGPIVLSRRASDAVRQHQRRANGSRFVAAMLLIALTAALELWGVSRERASIAAERRRIRRSVVEALAVRDSLGTVSEQLAAIRSLESSAPRWSTLIAALAEKLPTDAFLLSFTAQADSLRLEGAATRAAPVFDALSNMRGVKSVRPEAPIRQEVRDGSAPSEHFLLSALLDQSGIANAVVDRATTPSAPRRDAPGRAP